VVKDMGDENYIPWSERMRNEGRAEGREEGRAEGQQIGMVTAYLSLGLTENEIAEKMNLDIDKVRTIIKNIG
jgi:predicted transposase YdaD